MWLASFKQHSAVHGEVGKSATSVGLRAPAGRFDFFPFFFFFFLQNPPFLYSPCVKSDPTVIMRSSLALVFHVVTLCDPAAAFAFPRQWKVAKVGHQRAARTVPSLTRPELLHGRAEHRTTLQAAPRMELVPQSSSFIKRVFSIFLSAPVISLIALMALKRSQKKTASGSETIGQMFNFDQNFDDPSERRFAVTSEDQLKNINVMTCERCGTKIFPAFGRTYRFDRFGAKCHTCGTIGKFYDSNDVDDPRNIAKDGTNKALKAQEYMKKWVNADKEATRALKQDLADQCVAKAEEHRARQRAPDGAQRADAPRSEPPSGRDPGFTEGGPAREGRGEGSSTDGSPEGASRGPGLEVTP